jgi:hypothetical protein
MSTLDLLLSRVRGEYQEMPGLKLTFPQACRLWQLDAPTCEAILEHLVDERFLLRTAEGSYLAFPSIRLKVAKTSVPLQQARLSA